VNPVSGDLFVAGVGSISRYDGTSWTTELTESGLNSLEITDVVATDSGRIYAAFSGNSSAANEGVWTSPNGMAPWTRIAQLSGTTTPTGWEATGRIVLGLAPSNQDILYAFYDNGRTNTDAAPVIEADLWQWNQGTTTWTNYSSKLPDEPDDPYNPTTGSGASASNDPLSIFRGYDMVVNVKPDDQHFVVIGGTNAYKIEDITTDVMFSRIGGYASPDGYASYDVGDTHHPDIHALVFNPFNTSEMYSGSDGGIHITNNINAASVAWSNLNNNFQTYQYYHVGIDPMTGSDGIIGGSQDNGTSVGGTIFGLAGPTEMFSYAGGDGVAAEISRDDACVPFFFGFQNGFAYRECSTTGFTQINPSGAASEFVTYFHLDPDNNNALYYAGRNTLYRTTNSTNVTATVLPTAGALWTNMGNTGSIGTGYTDWFQRFATTRGTYTTSSYLLMGGDAGGIFRLDNPQNATDISSAIDITPPTASTSYPTICSGLAIHPTNPDIVMVTYANYGVNSIYITNNATAAIPDWTLVEQNLATFSIRSAAIVEANGKTLYLVGTARGLYANTDPLNNNWTIEAPNQIGFALISSLRYRPSDNKLLIGTHGNGMFMATVNETLSVESVDGKGILKLYPNPASTVINFNLESAIDRANYAIYDLMGRSVQKGVLSVTESRINVEGLNSGVYLVELFSGNMKSTGKFVKE
ncbi:MAG: T9SS type A sorting domain-containing protein, partial [Flavobacteriaceae bacterium]|nr:T9SS type A sorting domain-containing protein [Bacteroidia bacterium]NNL61400.1 T9SS type A sorting domain-containing protein [Flavobacteriaceae bacterium]